MVLDGVRMFGIAGVVWTVEIAGMVKGQNWDGRYGWDGWVGPDGWNGSKNLLGLTERPTTHAVTANTSTVLYWTPCCVSRSALVHLIP